MDAYIILSLFFIIPVILFVVFITKDFFRYKKRTRSKYLYKVTSRHPNRDIAGQIVRITQDDDKTATVKLVNPKIKKRTIYY